MIAERSVRGLKRRKIATGGEIKGYKHRMRREGGSRARERISSMRKGATSEEGGSWDS